MASGHPSNPRSRFSRQVKNGLMLTDRDGELLADLARHRLLSRGQIMGLGYFNSVARANSRLRLLFDHGYLRRRFIPEGSFGSEAYYEAGPSATDLVAERLQITQPEAWKLCRSPVKDLFVRHTLRVTDLRLALIASAKAADCSVERWRSEAECFHEYAVMERGGKWRWHSLRPDACLRVATPQGLRYCFLECDLGTCSMRVFKEKVARYREYLDTGIFAETYGCDGFAVLTVTCGNRRMESLVATCESVAQPAFHFSTFDHLDASWLFQTGPNRSSGKVLGIVKGWA